jgi:sugar phosphate isomerase/epimerase
MKPTMTVFQALGCALILGLSSPSTSSASEYKPELGIQTWTLRNMEFDEVVVFAKKHQISKLQMISKHMDPHAPVEVTKQKKALLDKNGLTCYSFGVAGTSLDQKQNRQLFEFAKLMGIKVIVVEPGDFAILDQLEELVKEFDIKIAIHNHGITSMYGNPLVVRALLKNRDSRMGVCMDVGWITSARFDAAKVFSEYGGRVYDIHLKDKKVNNTPNGDVATDTEIGKGDANYAGLFKALTEAKWDGVLAIETDSGAFAGDPNEFVGQAKVFVDTNFPE